GALRPACRSTARDSCRTSSDAPSSSTSAGVGTFLQAACEELDLAIGYPTPCTGQERAERRRQQGESDPAHHLVQTVPQFVIVEVVGQESFLQKSRQKRSQPLRAAGSHPVDPRLKQLG